MLCAYPLSLALAVLNGVILTRNMSISLVITVVSGVDKCHYSVFSIIRDNGGKSDARIIYKQG
jgi:hypothetical protein